MAVRKSNPAGTGTSVTSVLHFVTDGLSLGEQVRRVLAFALFRKNGRPHELTDAELEDARRRMVEEQLERRGIRDRRVLDAMARVGRHLFLDKQQWRSAYGDHPLPIGKDQTISQPYIVALMTEALELEGKERVLEIGTGSGYQTAVLAELADEVFTVEIISSLTEHAQSILLGTLGYENIHFRTGDGREGWPEQAPFDGILVTAAPSHVPSLLLDQLTEGGKLVIPVGTLNQELEVHRRRGGRFSIERLASVRFVPLVDAKEN